MRISDWSSDVCSSDLLEQFRFNRAVARIHELANVLAGFEADNAGARWVLREGIELLVRLLAPMMPHLGEELWERLGYSGYLVDQPWPNADAALASDERAVLAVQVNGKKRAINTLPVDLAEEVARRAGLAEPAGQRARRGSADRREERCQDG